jgi:hypothetical protein
MSLERVLSGKWFTRLVLIIWITCAVFVFVLFKNMELIVHGQLYYYGLRFSPDWADPYRIYTWLLYLCLVLPTALSGLALVSSFIKTEKVPEKQNTIPQRIRSQPVMVKVESRLAVRPERVENVDGDRISCPHCKKVFGRALVMLDFRNGKNRMVSVCPYCNYVLGNTSDERGFDENVHMAQPDEKTIQ